MKKNQIKQLASMCYEKGLLDEKSVTMALPYLSRKDLRLFIKQLIRFDQKNTVTVTSATLLSDKILSKIAGMYPNKKVQTVIDPSLLMGVRIVDNDIVYSANLSDILDKMVSHVSEV